MNLYGILPCSLAATQLTFPRPHLPPPARAAMFTTKSVQSLKTFFARYHEPPALSQMQSKQLLDGLKASFRDQLDREYGRSSDSTPGSRHSKGGGRGQVRRSATSQHLKSILSNPLFGYTTAASSKVQPPAAESKRDPMDVFDHAVSKGMMTLRAATGCLIAKSKQPQQAEGSVSPSETTVRVLRWLSSSGAENNQRFLDHEPFVNALAPILIAADREEVAWAWIKRAISDESIQVSDEIRTRRCSALLSSLVKVKSRPAYGDLNAAIATILDAEQFFKGQPLLPDVLVQPWRSVSWLTTVESAKQPAPTEELFEAHMATAGLLHHQVPIETAHLSLHHPTHPNFQPALDLFGDMKKLRALVQEFMSTKGVCKMPGEMDILPWIILLGHDTVHCLSETGREAEAQSLSALLRSEFKAPMEASLNPA